MRDLTVIGIAKRISIRRFSRSWKLSTSAPAGFSSRDRNHGAYPSQNIDCTLNSAIFLEFEKSLENSKYIRALFYLVADVCLLPCSFLHSFLGESFKISGFLSQNSRVMTWKTKKRTSKILARRFPTKIIFLSWQSMNSRKNNMTCNLLP